MGGFRNESLNIAFDGGVINIIIAHLIECSKQMRADCVKSSSFLQNNEDIITNKLIAKYLNIGANTFRYLPQLQEGYNDGTGRYTGRVDIRVIAFDDYFRDSEAYYIIECKRIDGGNRLNKAYITEGVARFFNPTPKPKYSSYYMQNIMFGYVVQTTDIPINADKIDKSQNTLLREVTAAKFVLKQSYDSQYCVYSCEYISTHLGKIELSHLFFNFTDVICKN